MMALMAQVQNWHDHEVTVKTAGSVDRKKWIQDMTDWAQQHCMQITWAGESTLHDLENDVVSHLAHFYIADNDQRILFLLRWAHTTL